MVTTASTPRLPSLFLWTSDQRVLRPLSRVPPRGSYGRNELVAFHRRHRRAGDACAIGELGLRQTQRQATLTDSVAIRR
jgi:hypothetical protein